MRTNVLQYEENPKAVTELPANVAVHCRNVVKSYGTGSAKVMALRGIDLDVYKGELLMLVGPSGCGKTTLISVIAGILDQDSGDCRVLGEDLMAMGQRRKTRFRGQNIGFVFQAFNLLEHLDVLRNVTIPASFAKQPKKDIEERGREALRRVGLTDFVHRRPAELSGG
ncbi:MAG TPA: ATP-binding cassette domain-containing protein, partial [Tepidisphaeraceae bacterium]